MGRNKAKPGKKKTQQFNTYLSPDDVLKLGGDDKVRKILKQAINEAFEEQLKLK